MAFNAKYFDIDSLYYEEVYNDIERLIDNADINSRNYPNFTRFVKVLENNNDVTGSLEGSYTFSRRTAYENLFLRDNNTVYLLGDIMQSTGSEKWFCEALSNGDFEDIDCLVRRECVYPVLEYIYSENNWSKRGSDNPIDLKVFEN